jgi:hypothetical protein
MVSVHLSFVVIVQVGPGIFELPYKLGTKFLFNDYWIVAVGERQLQQQ